MTGFNVNFHILNSYGKYFQSQENQLKQEGQGKYQIIKEID